ncbi:tRNA lysidine(34) synthetase TilS [Bordetella trematum]|uniref:tRNA lysidine(34) synthetase TilS n=1 Tax=Bordetella trematum TaxID=123899 RepID=UPI000D895670|nr:tRNA lysidine(34) synthetase TilS [Bordetella trematum]SPU54330.1 tRNAIle-lysidine synthetase (cell cycle protein) [Bordetella trematum]VDH02887.1 tRNA(Ile)-lysidine synthase [Bordetella trematum]
MSGLPDLSPYRALLGEAPLAKLRVAVARVPAGTPVGIALSAGPDSAMLALAAALALRDRPLWAFHVHHGLQADADTWSARAGALCALLGLPFQVARVSVPADGSGIEAAARQARYAALAQMAGAAGVGHILLAHHRDDQAETVLLRLLRGAGVAGLAAMRAEHRRDGLVYLRPWLDIGRDTLRDAAQAFARVSGWQAVDDPTNADPRYTRAAVRTALGPALAARWPGWQSIVARHARQMAEAADILDEVARADFAALAPGPQGQDFSLAAWRGLSAPRQALVLRHWLHGQGLRMPSEARLQELMRQLRQLHALGHDRDLRLQHDGHEIRCQRGRVSVMRQVDKLA